MMVILWIALGFVIGFMVGMYLIYGLLFDSVMIGCSCFYCRGLTCRNML